MRHLISTILLLFLGCLISFSQSITTAEYFFDTDPGIGNGIPITISSGTEWEFTIPVAGLDFGFHKLSIRIKGDDDIWSMSESRMFYRMFPSENEEKTSLSFGEYFFDSDPGVGDGTSFSFANKDTIEILEIVEPDGLSPGFHHFSYRFLNEQGVWGHSESRVLYIQPETEQAFELSEGEYFFNTDPGAGNGTTFTFSNSDSIDILEMVETKVLSPGFHRLSFRFINDLGIWSHSESRLFYIQPATEIAIVLVGGEYFFDIDPGIGSGTQFSLEANDTINIEQLIDATGLTEGFHKLSVRVYNENKIFSLSESRLFYVKPGTAVSENAKLVAMEYCIDDTPGNGNEIPVSVAEGDTIDIILDIPMTGISIGKHSISFCVINSEGTRSNSARDTFTIQIVDDLPPETPIPPEDIIVECAFEIPDPTELTATDDYDGEITVSPIDEESPGDCPNNFIVLRTWTFVDSYGNIASVAQSITVSDTKAPVIVCPPDVTVECDADNSSAATGTATATDDCDDDVTITESDVTTPGFCVQVSEIIRTWTAIDDCGNASSCTQIIKIVDTAAPSLTIPSNVTIECTEDVSPTSTGEASASDACGEVIISYNDFSLHGCGYTKIITRTWTALDECGNQTSADQTITVVDTQSPILTSPADVNIPCSTAVDPASTGEASATDACGEVTISYNDVSVVGCGCNEVITRTWTAVDECGNSTSQIQVITLVGETSLEIQSVSAPSEPIAINSFVNVSAIYFGDNIASASWDWGDGTITNGIIGNEILGSYTYEEAGVYTLTLTLKGCEGEVSYKHQYIVIYDPDGGFVTGGGWIMSPEGAYVAAPDLSGKANFGFVSKYKKGQSKPDGNTEFQFKAGNLNFKSIDYDWLIITGFKAKFKGVGTINNAGNYGFMLSAIDAELTPSASTDKFRIKIWDNDDGDNIVYDNNIFSDDAADPVTEIGGGSIVIHTVKKVKKSAQIESELIPDPEKLDISVYPNPTTGLVVIEIINFYNPNIDVRIMNITGQKVYEHSYQTAGQIELDISENISGMYYINLIVDEQHFVRKINLIRK